MTTPAISDSIKVIWEATGDGQLDPVFVEGDCIASGKSREPNIQVEKGTYFMQATANTGTEVKVSQYEWRSEEAWKLPILIPAGDAFKRPVTKGVIVSFPRRTWLYPQVNGGGGTSLQTQPSLSPSTLSDLCGVVA